MSRAAAVTGGLLLVAGLAVFLLKVLVYDVPTSPTDVRGLWQVGRRITARGNSRITSITSHQIGGA